MLTLKGAFAAVIRDSRKELGKTQKEFAYESKISVSALSWIERGMNAPNILTIFNMAKSLKLTPGELVDRVYTLNPKLE